MTASGGGWKLHQIGVTLIAESILQARSGRARGRLWPEGRDSTVVWEKGVIREIRPCAGSRGSCRWLVPSLFDLQINGFCGVDFQGECPTEFDLDRAVQGLAQTGCCRFFLTLITGEWGGLLERLRRLRDLRQRSPVLRSRIVGWHIEGPFLSAKPGYAGTHDPRVMLDPTREHIRQLRDTVGKDPLMITLAPEREGALEVIREAVRLNCRVSMGHSDASRTRLEAGIKAGASGFTHLGNGCPQHLDRHDNIVLRILDIGSLFTGVIPDRIHLSPPFFRMVHRLIPKERLYYTTDAMAAAGAGSGRFQLGDREFEVGPDRVVRQPGRENFAGSALTPIDGMRYAVEMLETSFIDLWGHFSVVPAQYAGVRIDLRPGAAATFLLVDSRDGFHLDRFEVVEAGVPGP